MSNRTAITIYVIFSVLAIGVLAVMLIKCNNKLCSPYTDTCNKSTNKSANKSIDIKLYFPNINNFSATLPNFNPLNDTDMVRTMSLSDNTGKTIGSMEYKIDGSNFIISSLLIPQLNIGYGKVIAIINFISDNRFNISDPSFYTPQLRRNRNYMIIKNY